jgi:hypothetical protein
MVLMVLMVPMTLLGLPPAAARAERTYTSEKTVTHDCAKEPEVAINAGGGSYTLTGACTKLTVTGADNRIKAESVGKISLNGSKNTLEVDAVDRLSVNGNNNAITYKRGVTGKPKVVALGADNKLTQVK